MGGRAGGRVVVCSYASARVCMSILRGQLENSKLLLPCTYIHDEQTGQAGGTGAHREASKDSIIVGHEQPHAPVKHIDVALEHTIKRVYHQALLAADYCLHQSHLERTTRIRAVIRRTQLRTEAERREAHIPWRDPHRDQRDSRT